MMKQPEPYASYFVFSTKYNKSCKGYEGQAKTVVVFREKCVYADFSEAYYSISW